MLHGPSGQVPHIAIIDRDSNTSASQPETIYLPNGHPVALVEDHIARACEKCMAQLIAEKADLYNAQERDCKKGRIKVQGRNHTGEEELMPTTAIEITGGTNHHTTPIPGKAPKRKRKEGQRCKETELAKALAEIPLEARWNSSTGTPASGTLANAKEETDTCQQNFRQHHLVTVEPKICARSKSAPPLQTQRPRKSEKQDSLQHIASRHILPIPEISPARPNAIASPPRTPNTGPETEGKSNTGLTTIITPWPTSASQISRHADTSSHGPATPRTPTTTSNTKSQADPGRSTSTPSPPSHRLRRIGRVFTTAQMDAIYGDRWRNPATSTEAAALLLDAVEPTAHESPDRVLRPGSPAPAPGLQSMTPLPAEEVMQTKPDADATTSTGKKRRRPDEGKECDDPTIDARKPQKLAKVKVRAQRRGVRKGDPCSAWAMRKLRVTNPRGGRLSEMYKSLKASKGEAEKSAYGDIVATMGRESRTGERREQEDKTREENGNGNGGEGEKVEEQEAGHRDEGDRDIEEDDGGYSDGQGYVYGFEDGHTIGITEVDGNVEWP